LEVTITLARWSAAEELGDHLHGQAVLPIGVGDDGPYWAEWYGGADAEAGGVRTGL